MVNTGGRRRIREAVIPGYSLERGLEFEVARDEYIIGPCYAIVLIDERWLKEREIICYEHHST